MMFSKKIPLALFLGLSAAVAFFACQKELSSEKDPSDNIVNPPTQTETAITSVQGRVLDEKKEPVKDAAVYFGSMSSTTDVNGAFIFEKVVVPKNTAVVVAKKNGYFNGSRTFVASANSLKYVQIQLLPKKEAGKFDAKGGGQINSAACQLTFQPNQVLTANNTLYDGNVSVLLNLINPEDKQFADIQPGALRGTDKTGKEVALQSYGMLAVELKGANGEELHLDSNKTVTVKYAIPTSLVNTAPATMPLWHFDEKSGLWQEEGTAIRSGAYYIGTVKHFSFWNLDYPFAKAIIKLRVIDKAGTPLQNIIVSLKTDGGMEGTAYTDDKGIVEGIVPADRVLTLNLKGQCQNIIYTHPQPVGPLGEDTDLGDLVADLTIPVLNVNGKVTDCDAAAVKGAYVSARIEGRTYRTYADNDGNYTLAILRCSTDPTTLEVSALDVSNNNSNSLTQTVTTTAAVSDLVVCKAAARFVNFTFNGTNYTFGEQDSTYGTHQVYGNGEAFVLGASNSLENIQWRVSSNTAIVPGTYKMDNYFTMRLSKGSYYSIDGNCTFTKIGAQVEGSINGTVCVDSFCVEKFPITGTFRIPVKQ